MPANEDNSAAFKDYFPLTDIKEFTGMLVLMGEWSLNGKKEERCCLSEQHIFVFTGKVILVILRLFTRVAM